MIILFISVSQSTTYLLRAEPACNDQFRSDCMCNLSKVKFIASVGGRLYGLYRFNSPLIRTICNFITGFFYSVFFAFSALKIFAMNI